MVTVNLSNGAATTATDTDGSFEFNNIQSGKYTLTLTAVGFNTIQSNITINKNLDLVFALEETVQTLDSVSITGKNRAMLLNEHAMTITSLNVKKMADFSMGAEEVLKTATGVVVRQYGGLGSALNINLNGLTGDAVRTYYDGIPLETYGHAIQLNTIPVDALERIDVYKGVIPVDIGTDALGGGINLVPVEVTKSQLRSSYSFGSFNTHRFTLNGTKNWNDKTSLSVSSFYNYSDNNYKMRGIPNLVENLDAQGNVLSVSEETIDAVRFHNQHQSSFIEASLSLKNRTWADKFTLSAAHSYRADEIQQGQFIISTAAGEAEAKINGFTQRMDYRKKFFNNKLTLRYFGMLSNASSRVHDSTQSIYNWTGQKFKTQNSGGAEIFGRPTLREGRNLGTAHRLTAHYQLASNTSLKFSDFFSHTRIKGEDPVARKLEIEGQVFDPNTIPSKLSKNIIGAELVQYFFDKKLTGIVLFKNYYYSAASIDLFASSATILPIRKINESQNGYGLAFKYDIHPTVFIRGSFEKAVRIPRDDEVFGDFLVILPNYTLLPEISNNINAGIAYHNKLGSQVYLSIQVDGFVRDRKNLIRLRPVGPENARFVNEAAVDGSGIELASKLDLFKHLNISWNATYQSSKISEVGQENEATSIGLQVPNIPRFFYNIGADYTFERIFKSPNNLKLFWTYFYTDRFSINEVADLDKANPTFIVPVQNMHNAGANYSLVKRGLSFSFNVQNAFNAKIYDNFRVPRPGFNYAFKINYTL
ncbi:TonB-dependent receptor [Niabella aquatica]